MWHFGTSAAVSQAVLSYYEAAPSPPKAPLEDALTAGFHDYSADIVLRYFGPLSPGCSCTTDRPCARFDQRERHLEPGPAIRPRHKRHPIPQRVLVPHCRLHRPAVALPYRLLALPQLRFSLAVVVTATELAGMARLEYVCADVRAEKTMWRDGEEIGDREGRIGLCGSNRDLEVTHGLPIES